MGFEDLMYAADVGRITHSVAVAVGVVVVVGGGACGVVRGEMFPDGVRAPEGSRAPPGWTRNAIATDEGVVEAWSKVGEGRKAEAPGAGLVFAHGNGETVDDWWPIFDEEYVRHGVSVMLVEFRGYGRSQGQKHDEDTLVGDADAAFDVFAKTPGVAPARIVVMGRPIGTGVGCGLART